jgi:uncharacterized membrane protein YeaQ/YmgE (transglycosylase-associated protein family)
MSDENREAAVNGDEHKKAMARANRWSQMLAIFGALVGYFAGSLLADNVEFGLLMAASIGIGVRIYVPYHASKGATETRGSAITEHPVTGNYNYGAVGSALIIGPFFTMLIATLEPDLLVAASVGAVATVLIFAVFRFALPK